MTQRNSQLGLAAGMMFAAANVFAAPVSLNYQFNTGNPGLASSPDGSLIASVSTVNSVKTPAIPVSTYSFTGGTNAGRIAASLSNFSDSISSFATNQGFKFQFGVGAGQALNITGISFWEQATNGTNSGGPTNWALWLDSAQGSPLWTGLAKAGQPGQSHTSSTVDGATYAFDGTPLTGLTGNVTLTLSAWGGSASGSWRIDDFTIQGNVAPAPVPVPAAVWLLGSALAGVAGLRRRAA